MCIDSLRIVKLHKRWHCTPTILISHLRFHLPYLYANGKNGGFIQQNSRLGYHAQNLLALCLALAEPKYVSSHGQCRHQPPLLFCIVTSDWNTWHHWPVNHSLHMFWILDSTLKKSAWMWIFKSLETGMTKTSATVRTNVHTYLVLTWSFQTPSIAGVNLIQIWFIEFNRSWTRFIWIKI
jgi:hypothetical protein